MEFLQEYGFIGLFFGSFMAATIVPFSSDFLLIGMLIAGGEPIMTLVSASLGNWLGGLTSYWLGYLGRVKLLEKWFNVNEEKLLKYKKWVDRYGSTLAFLCWLPFIGDVFAIALGFFRVDLLKSALFMLVGKTLRYVMWVVLYVNYGAHIKEGLFGF